MVLLLICGFRLQNPKNGTQQHWFATSGEVSFVAEATGEYDLYISTSSGQTPSATNLKLRVSKESEIEWEQGFINTPSFDYPSKVECVGDNIHLKICNKNINDNDYEIGTILDDTGYEGTSKNYIRSKNYLRLDSGDYTIFAYKFSGISILNTAIRLYDKNKKYLRSLYIGRIDANTFNFNITEDVYFGRLVCLNNEEVPSDFSVEIQIEKGTTKTNYKEHEEQNYVIPVQQRMFSGDKFIKLDGQWKEMHTFKETKLSEVSSWTKIDNSQQSDTILRFSTNFSDGKLVKNLRTSPRTFWSDKSECVYILDAYKKECLAPHSGVVGQLNVFINKNRLLDETVETFKEYLKNNEIIVYYKLAEPLYLDCTPEQIAVLDKIEQEAHTYSEVTNVYTEDEVGAIIKTNTAVDLKTVINNVVEAQLQERGG